MQKENEEIEKKQRRYFQELILLGMVLFFFVLFPSPFGLIMTGVYLGMFIKSEPKDMFNVPIMLGILIFLPVILLQSHGRLRVL